MKTPKTPARRLRRPLSQLILLAVLLAAAPLAASGLEERVVERTLGNGMRILILPRHQAPVVSFCMKFKAGPVDEPAGRSGMAHLLEHMLFKGTTRLGTTDWEREEPILRRVEQTAVRLDALRLRAEREGRQIAEEPEAEALRRELARLQEEERRFIVKDEIDSIYARNGAENFNAFTDYDLTTYRVDLPANRVELWAAIESDRMRHPVLREFYSERDVVMEERRQSYDSQPSRLLMELFLATAFLAHPYGRPIIGWPSDIGYLPLGETETFFRENYSPDRTVLAVVGDVDPAGVMAVLESRFGSIPPSSRAGERHATGEPAQRGERRVFLEADANPSLMIGYHKPALPHRDDYVLDLIDGMLSTGRTSRLYRLLVDREKAASSVSTVNGFPGSRFDNLFTFTVTPLSPRTPEEVERLIYGELERLKTEPASAEELDKVKTRMKADFVRGLESNAGLADTLSHYEAITGDWRYVSRHASVLDGITPDEIMAVARRYFTPENRTVAVLKKKENGEAKKAPAGAGGSGGTP